MKLDQMQRQQYAFVAMPYGTSTDALYRHIRRGVIAAGLRCVREDKIPHTRSIQEFVFELVQKSKLVIFVADGGNSQRLLRSGLRRRHAQRGDRRLAIRARIALRPDQLLDVGCGTGSTTVAIARRLGTVAACVGVDISEPILAAARARADCEGVAATFYLRRRADLLTSRWFVVLELGIVAADSGRTEHLGIIVMLPPTARCESAPNSQSSF
jgi:SAM-dependent methyltransferase